MFNASLLYYGYKVATQAALWALGWTLACAAGGSWSLVLASALAYSLFLQQSGWLAHDFLHHQVFKNRFLGHLAGIFWGNVAQGFSISWWLNKHNAHHAVPNLVESAADAADGDPDIDTMPFLAWSRQMFRQREAQLRKSAAGRWMIRNQHFLYFPLLGLARASWAFQVPEPAGELLVRPKYPTPTQPHLSLNSCPPYEIMGVFRFHGLGQMKTVRGSQTSASPRA
jgi:acyl-lipid Delta6-acetylenase / acyl-lipid (9-3)-desaturase